MVKWRIYTSPSQSSLAIICMPGQPPAKATWLLIALDLRDAPFSTQKKKKRKERDATLRWIYCQTKCKPFPY